MNTNITMILEAAISLAVALITTFVIPWLKQKVEAEKLSKILTYVHMAVGAAEQLAKVNGWDGDRKKNYVENYIRGLGFMVDVETLDAMIENAVIELHAELTA